MLYTQALAGGAQACGAPVGRLSVGYRADWLVLDGQDPLPGGSPPPEILNRWLFAGHAGQIRDVYVGGTPALSMGNMRSNRPLPLLIFCRYCANWRRRQHGFRAGSVFPRPGCRSVAGVMAAAKPAKLSAGRQGRRILTGVPALPLSRRMARFPLSPALRVPSRC